MSSTAVKILQLPRIFSKQCSFQRCVFRFAHRSTFLSQIDKQPYQQSPVRWDSQSVLLPGNERARATKLTNNPYEIIDAIPGAPEIKTIYDVLSYGHKISRNGDCIGSKSPITNQYEWMSYSDVILNSQYVGSALMHLGLKPGNETYVGVFGANRNEFFFTLYGCAGYSMILIPLYISLGAEAVLFIIKQVSFPLVIVDSNKNAVNILKNAASIPILKTLVIMDKPDAETTEAAKSENINLLPFTEFLELGKNNKHDLVMPKPDDLFCIPYTSGTTGIPKGVMLTHRNVLSCLSSLVYSYGVAGIFGGTILSYLPPAHIYEIMNEVASMYFARRIAFYSGDIRKLFDEVRLLKPTILPLVPRLMNLVYMHTMEKVKGNAVKSFLFKVGLLRKSKLVQRGIISKNNIWDKLVFKKFQEALGGKVHMIITTSAPVSPEIMRFFRCASGCYIFEGYGQTEVLAATLTLPFEHDGGFVGPPLPCNHVKLADVPEMGYFAKDDVGEVCFKGVNVFQGYFKNEEATKECLDSDGWHHSGDIGKWLPNGCLKIIDRKKHLFKLSQGEYIAPEKVENAYIHSKQVLQVYVDGLSDQDFVVALVVPEPNNFKCWAKKNSFKTENFQELLQDKEVRKAFLLELQKIGKCDDLNPLEQAKNLSFLSEPFSVENGLLTPTLKLKRNNARKVYEPLLKQLYEEGPLVTSSKYY